MTAPSASSIPNSTITTGAENRVINLQNIFFDDQDSSIPLTYTVVSVVPAVGDPAIFNSLTIDDPAAIPNGILTLQYNGAVGSSTVKVKATDAEGLTAEATFTVKAIAATDGNNTLNGSDGEDSLNGAAGDDSISGFNLNDTLIGGTGIDTLVGGTGNDVYSVDEATDVVTENSNEGTDTVKSFITYTLKGNVENLILESSAGNGIGNTLDNTITGNGSVNVINGGLGSDTMAGGADNDTYVVDNTGDVVNESATLGGIDTVQSSIDYTLGANVERLNLTGTAVSGTGNTADNTITGNATANTLSGGAGSDAMEGAAGNDIYVVDNTGDNVTEDSTLAEEVDTVQSSVTTYTLGANVENLTLTGSAVEGKGNGLYNTITGNTVGNTLDGGVGNDTVIGGAGNDTYVIDATGDEVIETSTSSAEIDTVKSSLLNYTLGANVEKLELAGTNAINGKGNELDNTLTGNSANNKLDGASGDDTIDGKAGDDSMNGGAGSDTYIVDKAADTLLGTTGDTVTETTVDPLDIDTVKSSVDHILGTNVEKLELTGSGAISGTGNGDKNTIIGNNFANLINGAGDHDIMTGKGGNDTYVVDTTGDLVTELTGEGTDTVKSTVNYTLGSNVEKLELTGNDTVSGTGNTLDNTLTGNSAANTLSGGTGNDAMKGAGGNDIYVVDAALDVVDESALASGAGTDTVQSSVTETLDAQVENLTLTGVNAINGKGNALGNTILGNSAANEIDGGIGSDTMKGGTGNDIYVVDEAANALLGTTGDIVQEISTVASETDLVKSSVGYTLGAHVEKLELTGNDVIDGTGNDLSNSITGNASNNTLSGLLGSDTMTGGLGNDTYVVDATGDVVTDVADTLDAQETIATSGGTETVQSSVTYTLGANLENLELTVPSDASKIDINGTGNTLNNSIKGNTGKNTLSGGAGTDTLIGMGGDDTYLVDTTTDTITEDTLAGAGTDTVSSSVSYGLGNNLENLILTGTTAIDGTGNILNNKLTGNTAANVLKGQGGSDTMIGGTGGDSYFVDVTGDIVQETSTVVTEIDTVTSAVSYDLRTNDLSTANLNGTNVANVENLTLTGLLGTENLNGTGNALNNTIKGNAGVNTLDGKTGSDKLIGGNESDKYIVESVGDVVTELPGQGDADKIESSVTYTLGANVEDLTLTLKGSTLNTTVDNINATGNDLANTITGNAGNNILSGGAETDELIGGAGDDTYFVDVTNDTVSENLNEGTDTISSSVTYSLDNHLENLTLTGTTAVDGIGINGTGNGLDNKITGNTVGNTLDGGEGKDTMTGGTGKDTYVVDNPLDVVTETSSLTTETEKEDLVKSSVTYTLGANVEKLTLTASAISGTGNTLNNTILGNDGANQIDGKAGNDTMTGGLGNDTYTVDATLDDVKESASGGTDLVKSSATYTLGKNEEIENLTLDGTTAINGTGNSIANTITGNTGNNLIDGLGGIDTMIGKAGNDTYTVDVTGDIVTEAADKDALNNPIIDTVKSSANYTLSENVENLTLTLAQPLIPPNTTGLSGTGNASKNTITGTTANDTLSGGTDNDTMIGGTGSDTYTVDATLDVVTETLVSTLATEADTVNSSAPTYTLSANVENLTLTTDAGDINGTGNTLNNTIVGNAGINILSGSTGNDAMTGGASDDTYIVDATGDVVTEALNGGSGDMVESSVTETLDDNVEKLKLTGISAINGTGNNLANTITGNGAANTLSGGAVNSVTGLPIPGIGGDAMTGGLGGDIYVVDAEADTVTESSTLATEIDTVQSSITYILGDNVEKLTLTGTAVINGTGNTGNNTITGNGAANTLSGLAGNDAMTGLAGNDIYVVDATGDVVTEATDAGDDTVQSSVTYTLGTNVEKLTLTGGVTAINGTGNTLNNTIVGNDGINTLSGSTGNDTMSGGAANDTYIVDAAGDVVTETSVVGAGDDTVQSSVTRILDANVENLTLTGTNSINGTGNGLNNTILGNSAANTLDGLIGDDAMKGAAGNDIYVVNAIGDVVTELAAGGTDTVQSSVSETLDAQVENLTLTGTAASGTGNALNNTITGNAANNILSGDNDVLPSLTIPTDNDTMIGGLGNDTYTVDATGDVITEAADTVDANGAIISGGTDDTVQSSVTETLDANVENLTLIGAGDINGTGNALNNTIIGNDGINILSGGAGVDKLEGAGGNDTYIVDSTTDTIIDTAGTDLVSSSVSYTLGANLDNLTLTGTSVINGTGNIGNNTLIGNTAVNTLTGGDGNDSLTGGAGNDKFTGGAGNDKFIYDTNVAFTSSGVGIDVINDFVSGTDKIVLDKTTFVALASNAGNGFNVSSDFATVATDTLASTSPALIVYSSASDNLFYNQNGVTAGYGTGAQFADLDGVVAASDFELQA